jgi:hypothetical protein
VAKRAVTAANPFAVWLVMNLRLKHRGGLSVVLVATLVAACQDKQPEEPLREGSFCCGDTTGIYLVKAFPNGGGDGQTGLAGTTLSDSLAVRVITATGFPVGGVPIRWAADSGGSISPGLSYTNDNGISKAQWTLGSKPGLQSATVYSENTRNPGQFWAIATALEPVAGLVGSARRER